MSFGVYELVIKFPTLRVQELPDLAPAQKPSDIPVINEDVGMDLTAHG